MDHDYDHVDDADYMGIGSENPHTSSTGTLGSATTHSSYDSINDPTRHGISMFATARTRGASVAKLAAPTPEEKALYTSGAFFEELHCGARLLHYLLDSQPGTYRPTLGNLLGEELRIRLVPLDFFRLLVPEEDSAAAAAAATNSSLAQQSITQLNLVSAHILDEVADMFEDEPAPSLAALVG